LDCRNGCGACLRVTRHAFLESSPWAVESPSAQALASIVMPDAECVVLFHVPIGGECVVECQSHPAVKMETGDVIVFPHGHPHTMGSRDAVTPHPSVLSSLLARGTSCRRSASAAAAGRRASCAAT
jgi:hypothetical protein